MSTTLTTFASFVHWRGIQEIQIRWNFEKKGLQFAQHVSEVHNLWDYVAFIVHLNKVGKENMNGIETYIHTKVTNRDMSWAP